MHFFLRQSVIYKVGFEVHTAVSTKMAVFWVVLMEAARTSETLVNFYQATTQTTTIFVIYKIAERQQNQNCVCSRNCVPACGLHWHFNTSPSVR
jgi:hypothetical protein